MVVILGLFFAVVALGFVISQVIVFQDNTVALTGVIRQFIGGMGLYFTVLIAFVALILFAAVTIFLVSQLKG